MTQVKPVKGLGWSCAAVSNSEWTGVRLRDVLEHAGVDVNNPGNAGIEHVQFEGETSPSEVLISILMVGTHDGRRTIIFILVTSSIFWSY